MNVIFAMVVGVLFAAAFYLMLRRNIVRLIIGLTLLSHGANLLIFTASGLVRGKAPIIGADAVEPGGGGQGADSGVMADPLPQALILTAIVISFGLIAFTLVLLHRSNDQFGTADVDQL